MLGSRARCPRPSRDHRLAHDEHAAHVELEAAIPVFDAALGDRSLVDPPRNLKECPRRPLTRLTSRPTLSSVTSAEAVIDGFFDSPRRASD